MLNLKLLPQRPCKEYSEVSKFIDEFHSNPDWLWTIEDTLKRPNLRQFLIQWDDDLIGITSWQRFSNTLAILQKHIMHPNAQGRGWGKQALELVEKDAKAEGILKMSAYVLETNYGMVQLLLKAGYTMEGHLKKHFHPNLGCYIFGKDLA